MAPAKETILSRCCLRGERSAFLDQDVVRREVGPEPEQTGGSQARCVHGALYPRQPGLGKPGYFPAAQWKIRRRKVKIRGTSTACENSQRSVPLDFDVSCCGLRLERHRCRRCDLNDVRTAGLWTPDYLRAESGRQARKHWGRARTAKKCMAGSAWITGGKDRGRDPPGIATRPGCEFSVSKVAQIPLRNALW